MDLWSPHLFAVTFLAQSVVALIAGVVLIGVRLPRVSVAVQDAGAVRPSSVIGRQPKFIAAVTCGTVAYLLMNCLMTAAPLAMHLCGHSQSDSDLGLQWHVFAIYAPSFFAGHLVSRFGALLVAAVELALTGISAVVGFGGIDIAHFWGTLILLTGGWNFGILGASALVLECHTPAERTQVQSLNHFIIFGLIAVGSFASGGLLSAYGWNTVLWVPFVPLVLAAVALVAWPTGHGSILGSRHRSESRSNPVCRNHCDTVLVF